MPPTRPDVFYEAKQTAWRDFYVRGQDARYKRTPKTVTATFAGGNRVSWNGRKTPFVNRDNLSLVVGDTVRVKNVGRPAAVAYVPSDESDLE